MLQGAYAEVNNFPIATNQQLTKQQVMINNYELELSLVYDVRLLAPDKELEAQVLGKLDSTNQFYVAYTHYTNAKKSYNGKSVTFEKNTIVPLIDTSTPQGKAILNEDINFLKNAIANGNKDYYTYLCLAFDYACLDDTAGFKENLVKTLELLKEYNHKDLLVVDNMDPVKDQGLYVLYGIYRFMEENNGSLNIDFSKNMYKRTTALRGLVIENDKIYVNIDMDNLLSCINISKLQNLSKVVREKDSINNALYNSFNSELTQIVGNKIIAYGIAATSNKNYALAEKNAKWLYLKNAAAFDACCNIIESLEELKHKKNPDLPSNIYEIGSEKLITVDTKRCLKIDKILHGALNDDDTVGVVIEAEIPKELR